MAALPGPRQAQPAGRGPPPELRDGLGRGLHDLRRGLPEWEQAAVFERFRRVGTNLEWSTQGPGLGLAIAAELAQQMQVQLELESSPGEGACFRVTAPRTALDDPGVATAATPTPGRP